MATCEIYEVLSIFILYMRGQIIQTLYFVVVSKINVSLLFSGELNTGHCDAVLPVHEKGKLGIFDKVHFL
jgi:hypothetical protein